MEKQKIVEASGNAAETAKIVEIIEIGSVTEMTKGFDFEGKMEVKLGDYVEWDS